MIRNFEEIRFDDIAWSDDSSRTTFRRVPPLLRLSVREVGVLNPLIVAETQLPDRYAIVTGWLRFQAAREVGENSVPCHIYRSFPPKILLLCSLFDNIGHRHMNVVEQGVALKKLTEYYTTAEIKRTFLPLLGVHVAGENWEPLVRLAELEEDLQWAIVDGAIQGSAAERLTAIPHGHRQHIVRLFRSVPMGESAQVEAAEGFRILMQKDVTPLELMREENWVEDTTKTPNPDEKLEQDLLQLEVGLAAAPTLFGGRREKKAGGSGNVLAPGERPKPAAANVAPAKKRKKATPAAGPAIQASEADVLGALSRRLGVRAQGAAKHALPSGARIVNAKAAGKNPRLEVEFATPAQLCSTLRELLNAEERGALQAMLARR
jgi:ParB-like chromosome segregation protein Spo0J